MSQQILLKRSSVADKVPTIVQLADGEIALNTYNGVLYVRKNQGGPSVVEVGAHAVTGDLTGTLSKGGGALTLSNSGVTAGSYGTVTVDAKGRVVAGAPQLISDCGDSAITAPSNGQLLQFNGTDWVNVDALPTSASGVLGVWTLVSGNTYYADFVHNLGTSNVVIGLYDNSNNAIVQAGSVVLTNANTVRVTVAGNSKTLCITVIANGLSVGGKTAGTAILEGPFSARPPAGNVDTLYLAHDSRVLYRDNGVTWDIMFASSGAVKTLSYFASSMDSPNTVDFAVNALAPVVSDPSNSAINVRSFSNTAEQGVCITVPVPLGANNITFNIRGHSATAPAGTAVVQHKLYQRLIPNNAALGSWTVGTAFTAFTVPLNAYYQLLQQTFTLQSLGLSVGNTYQFELTRMTGIANNLAYAWLVAELTVVFD